METTQDERDRGILMIRAMTLKDFLVLIDRKTEEFEDKAAIYMKECKDDLSLVTDMPPFEIQSCVKFHEIYLQKLREMLAELKQTTVKNFDDKHMIPVQVVELYVDMARKATTARYEKLEPSLQRVR